MKKYMYINIFVLLLLTMINLSCRNSSFDPYKDIPNPKDVSAPVVLVDKVNTAVINVTDLANSAYSIDLSSRGPVKSFEVQVFVKRVVAGVTFLSDTIKLKTVAVFPSTFTMKASEIVAVVPNLEQRSANGQSLYNPAVPATFIALTSTASLLAGDEIGLVGIIEGQDGIKYEIKNLNIDLISNPGQRIASRLVTFISCPFNGAQSAGTYKITTDAWDGLLVPIASYSLQVVAGPGANQVTIKDPWGHFAQEGNAAHPYNVIVDVNPDTGQATIAAQEAQNSALFGLTNGYISVDGSGFCFSCTGQIKVNLQHRVTAGTFSGGPYLYEILKQ